MATEILQMAVDPLSLDVNNPLVTFGGTLGARLMKVNMPLDYKDGRLPQPFRSGGYDPRLTSDSLIGAPRTCKVQFGEVFTQATPNYKAVYDKYALALREGAIVGLIFRTTDGQQRLRYARLLSMPWKADESTPFSADMDMTFAVDFYARDLYPAGAVYYDSGTAFTYDDGFRYDTSGVVLPIIATTLNGATGLSATSFTLTNAAGLVNGLTILIDTGTQAESLVIQNVVGNVVTTTTGATKTHANGVAVVTQAVSFTVNSTVAVVDATVVLTGPIIGPVQVSIFYGANNAFSTSFIISDTLVVQGSGYIEYYQVESGPQTVTKNGIEIFDMGKFILPGGQNDWLRVGPGTNTLSVTCPYTGLGVSSAIYLNYVPHYL